MLEKLIILYLNVLLLMKFFDKMLLLILLLGSDDLAHLYHKSHIYHISHKISEHDLK